MLRYVDGGGRKTEACRLFQVDRKTIYNWLQLRAESGTVEMRRTGRKTPHKIDATRLSAYVAEHPDAYLSEIGKAFEVSASGICRALRRTKISRKKNAALPGAPRRSAAKTP